MLARWLHIALCVICDCPSGIVRDAIFKFSLRVVSILHETIQLTVFKGVLHLAHLSVLPSMSYAPFVFLC